MGLFLPKGWPCWLWLSLADGDRPEASGLSLNWELENEARKLCQIAVKKTQCAQEPPWLPPPPRPPLPMSTLWGFTAATASSGAWPNDHLGQDVGPDSEMDTWELVDEKETSFLSSHDGSLIRFLAWSPLDGLSYKKT